MRNRNTQSKDPFTVNVPVQYPGALGLLQCVSRLCGERTPKESRCCDLGERDPSTAHRPFLRTDDAPLRMTISWDERIDSNPMDIKADCSGVLQLLLAVVLGAAMWMPLPAIAQDAPPADKPAQAGQTPATQ